MKIAKKLIFIFLIIRCSYIENEIENNDRKKQIAKRNYSLCVILSQGLTDGKAVVALLTTCVFKYHEAFKKDSDQ